MNIKYFFLKHDRAHNFCVDIKKKMEFFALIELKLVLNDHFDKPTRKDGLQIFLLVLNQVNAEICLFIIILRRGSMQHFTKTSNAFLRVSIYIQIKLTLRCHCRLAAK